jgi:flavin reductase (DIM6/NTAB) family NADH-FMN oxidoreductase RutF
MLKIYPKEISVPKLHSYLLGAVTPRPIALASTVDAAGNVNLSPFSFFNCFGSNPPLLVFSPARRGRDSTTKHTYENILEVKEVVINVVNYAMVQQTSLASTEFPKGVNEFIKSGLTPIQSELVKPPRVAESPIHMECKVLQVIETGMGGGAGNLILCEVLLMHIKDEVLDEQGRIDPYKVDAVARLGGDYYARVHSDAIFTVPKPLDKVGIGIDQLPENIRYSKVLTGNDLGMLANVEKLPDMSEVNAFYVEIKKEKAIPQDEFGLHQLAKEAWKILLFTRIK